jgi:photosystem I subunit 3
MRQLFALMLVFALWFGVAPSASAESDVSGLLVPCRDSAAFAQRAKDSISATAAERFQKYADAGLLCGKDDGLQMVISIMQASLLFRACCFYIWLVGWVGQVATICKPCIKMASMNIKRFRSTCLLRFKASLPLCFGL